LKWKARLKTKKKVNNRDSVPKNEFITLDLMINKKCIYDTNATNLDLRASLKTPMLIYISEC